MTFAWLDERPLVLAIAGPNGAGKSTFYHAHLAPAGLPRVNADVLAVRLALPPYDAARVAGRLRRELLIQPQSFVFETVFSDPVGEKLAFLREASESGYTVGLIFIGLDSVKMSAERVAMRVSQGEHDVPADKLRGRYPRTLANLAAAVDTLPHLLVYDNSDLARPFRLLATFADGVETREPGGMPRWYRTLRP